MISLKSCLKSNFRDPVIRTFFVDFLEIHYQYNSIYCLWQHGSPKKREIDRERETERLRDRENETERQTERQRDSNRERHRHRERERDREKVILVK